MNIDEHVSGYFQDNIMIWEKKDTRRTLLRFWKRRFPCERCGKEANLTSLLQHIGIPHPICNECYKELHAYHIVLEARLL